MAWRFVKGFELRFIKGFELRFIKGFELLRSLFCVGFAGLLKGYKCSIRPRGYRKGYYKVSRNHSLWFIWLWDSLESYIRNL